MLRLLAMLGAYLRVVRWWQGGVLWCLSKGLIIWLPNLGSGTITDLLLSPFQQGR